MMESDVALSLGTGMSMEDAAMRIHNYFDESQKPKGSMWKGALIVKGAHGRLDNISPEGNQQTFKHNKQLCNTCLNNT